MEIAMKVPYSETLLSSILRDFGWSFDEMIQYGAKHPVATGNCDHSGHDPHVAGNEETGMYMNAAYACQHCYGGNAAMLVWHPKDGIALHCDTISTKPERMLRLYRKHTEKQLISPIGDYSKAYEF